MEFFKSICLNFFALFNSFCASILLRGDLSEDGEERDLEILLFGVRDWGLIGDLLCREDFDDLRFFFLAAAADVLDSFLLAGFLALADDVKRRFFFALGRAMKLSESEKGPGVAPGEKKVSSLDWDKERLLDRTGLRGDVNSMDEGPKENLCTYSSFAEGKQK